MPDEAASEEQSPQSVRDTLPARGATPGTPGPETPERPAGPITVNRPGDMSWSGIQTFAKLPLCLTPADLRAGKVDVAVGGAPWEGTATGRTGTHLGPRAIRDSDYLSRGVRPHLDVRVDPFDHL